MSKLLNYWYMPAVLFFAMISVVLGCGGGGGSGSGDIGSAPLIDDESTLSFNNGGGTLSLTGSQGSIMYSSSSIMNLGVGSLTIGSLVDIQGEGELSTDQRVYSWIVTSSSDEKHVPVGTSYVVSLDSLLDGSDVGASDTTIQFPDGSSLKIVQGELRLID
ncbi:hypothetical protein [Poriferisphaera sp. WC338]|uniref:hypothetical protein n=1 Tax=Poriferisphaera sp. WC338 TaxID=3425129 RepID=UPI003D81707D